jgi:hypothetical protein
MKIFYLFIMNQPRNKRTETLNPPHPNFQLEMKTKHVSIFYLLCMIRPVKTEIIALSIKKKNYQLSSLLYIKDTYNCGLKYDVTILLF